MLTFTSISRKCLLLFILMLISFDSTTAVSAGDFLHFDTDELQVNKRELVEFQKGHLFQGDMVATEQMCGLVCKRHDWCKTFNHHALGKVCQLIMTDFRLLNTTQDDQSTPLTTGWRHFSPKYFVRGSGSKPIDQSIRLWVNETQTNDNSISVQWSAAEQGDFSSFVITGQQLDITNVDHPSQTGLIAADLISHYPNAQTRTFTSIGHMIPGVKYNFEQNSFYNGAVAQMPLYTSESTFPSFVVENPSLRVITSHTIDIHWTFNGSAQEMDIWHSPITGSCPCNLPAIGTLTHQIHSLIAGEEYYLSTQLTSKYGKKGPIRTIIQSTYTDDVIFDDTTTTLTSLDLLVQIESGVGNQMWVDMTPELGGVTGELYKDFNLLTEFKFVNLEPGDLYKLNLTVESRGERPLYRSFQFQDSTFPEEPVLTLGSIVPTEHTLEFAWTVPYFFNNVLVWNDPADGNCPCPFNNDSPNTGTISDLEAGEEYAIYAQSESDYGKTSTTMSFTHSLYTDVITNVEISSTIDTITFEPHFESGVGAGIAVEVRGVDYYHSDVLNQPFQLEPIFVLENLMPGSKYEWEMSVTSRGSNPLLRHYSYLGYTYPEQPLGVKDALALMLEHDVFELTVGPTPLEEGSTTTFKVSWAQQPRVEVFKISIAPLSLDFQHSVLTTGQWSLQRDVQLTPGEQYETTVTPVSYGLEGDSEVFVESLYPLPPSEDTGSRTVAKDQIDFTLSYQGVVQNLKLRINPHDGNCLAGCAYTNPLPSRISLTGLSPGQAYWIDLQTDSYGKESVENNFSVCLPPDEIRNFTSISSTDEIVLEFQIQSGVGSEIEIDYEGEYSHHSGRLNFTFRLTNRRVLTDLVPGETYHITVTVTGMWGEGAGGCSAESVSAQTTADTYPLPPVEYEWRRTYTYMSVTLAYAIPAGGFSHVEFSTASGTGQCNPPCISYDGNSTYTIGTEGYKLEAGAENIFYLQTVSKAGLKSVMFSVMQALPVAEVKRDNSHATLDSVTFSLEFHTGVGKKILTNASDENGTLVGEHKFDPYGPIWERTFVGLAPGTCVFLDLLAWSQGADPIISSFSFIKGTIPNEPTRNDAGGGNLFTLNVGISPSDVETPSSAIFTWFHTGNLDFFFVKLFVATYQRTLEITLYPESIGWSHYENWSLVSGGAAIQFWVNATRCDTPSATAYSFTKIMRPYPLSYLRVNDVTPGENFLEFTMRANGYYDSIYFKLYRTNPTTGAEGAIKADAVSRGTTYYKVENLLMGYSYRAEGWPVRSGLQADRVDVSVVIPVNAYDINITRVLPHDDELVLWLTSRAGPYIEKFVMTYNKSQSEIVQSECEIKSDEALDDKLCPLRPDAAFNTEEFDEMHFLTYYELTYWVVSSGVESIKRSLIFNTKTRDVTRRTPWVTTNTAADTRSYHYTYDYHPKQPLDFMWCQKPSNAASFKYTGCDEVNDVNNTLCFYDETCYSSYCKFYGVIEFDAALLVDKRRLIKIKDLERGF